MMACRKSLLMSSAAQEPSGLSLAHSMKKLTEKHEEEEEALYHAVKPLYILNHFSRNCIPLLRYSVMHGLTVIPTLFLLKHVETSYPERKVL